MSTPSSMKVVGRIERRRARAHLHGLLDDLCADFGLDPEVAWRGPSRAAEHERVVAPMRRLGERIRKALGLEAPISD